MMMAPSLFLVLFSVFIHLQKPDPKFLAQVIDSNISIGYGLAIGDVDGDGKADILLADKKQFVWYRNGDWKRFVMVENLTASDNVCIAARDIDGDGKVEVAVGAQWNPSETSDTIKSGSVHFLLRPDDPTQKWTPVELHHEPTVHSMRWVKTASYGSNDRPFNFQLIVVPLHGRGNKGGEGQGVKIIAYEMPKNPAGEWKYTLVDQSMHLTHNFEVVDLGVSGESIIVAGKEGRKGFWFSQQGWTEVTHEYWKGDNAMGEIRTGKTRDGVFLTTIEPMHGNKLAVYSSDGKSFALLTSDLNQGHALASADVLGFGDDQIVVGWREPDKENKTGIKIFVSQNAAGTKWLDFWIDNNGISCEDLQIADLDGDGRKDIIASGRATHNLKIYWNKNERRPILIR